MRAIIAIAIAAGALALAAQDQPRCANCPQSATAAATRAIPGTNESVPVGRIENLMPIAVLAALGCDACTGEAVAWALQQGSSKQDVERALRTIAAMQKLDCFKQKFGQDAAARLERPLAAARKALEQTAVRAAK